MYKYESSHNKLLYIDSTRRYVCPRTPSFIIYNIIRFRICRNFIKHVEGEGSRKNTTSKAAW